MRYGIAYIDDTTCVRFLDKDIVRYNGNIFGNPFVQNVSRRMLNLNFVGRERCMLDYIKP